MSITAVAISSRDVDTASLLPRQTLQEEGSHNQRPPTRDLDGTSLPARRRDPDNRRVHLVELTQAGEAMFLKLRAAALIFDKRLRAGLPDDRLAEFAEVLAALRANVAPAK